MDTKKLTNEILKGVMIPIIVSVMFWIGSNLIYAYSISQDIRRLPEKVDVQRRDIDSAHNCIIILKTRLDKQEIIMDRAVSDITETRKNTEDIKNLIIISKIK